MPRPLKRFPRYLAHASGKARAVWTDPVLGRREKILPGLFNSSESLQAFARLQLELATGVEKPAVLSEGPTVVEVLLPYIRYVDSYYDPDHSEPAMIRSALKVVRELYGLDPVASFGPKKLAAVRVAFVQKGWSRPYVNRQVGKIVRAFKWAASEELAPAAVYQALKTMAPLRRSHCDAPEPEPRQPVPAADAVATLPFLPLHVRSIVELMRLTGMRPSEVCWMTLNQIDRTGAVWIYRPSRHKNAHRGHHRMVALGVAAQAVIAAHLHGRVLGDEEPLFSPRRQREERFAAMRAKRKSKVQPSQMSRKKAKALRLPGEWFTSEAVAHAVAKAAKKAGVPPWSPYQLRHLKGAELREKFSLEHVRAALGHSHASMSAHYAKGADEVLAAEVARAMG
jgi:integrase